MLRKGHCISDEIEIYQNGVVESPKVHANCIRGRSKRHPGSPTFPNMQHDVHHEGSGDRRRAPFLRSRRDLGAHRTQTGCGTPKSIQI